MSDITEIAPITVKFGICDLGPDGEVRMVSIEKGDSQISLTIEQAQALAGQIKQRLGLGEVK